MGFRIGSAIVSLALAVSMTVVALAQADDGTANGDEGATVDAPAQVDPSTVAPTLYLQLSNPTEQDLEVPLETVQLMVQGTTLRGAVVSIDGDLVDTDDQGQFSGTADLDEGANEIEIVASDGDGNQVSTTLFVVRGE